MVDGNQFVFVYGTLRKGGRLHEFYLGGSRNSRLVGDATVQGDLFDCGSFPAAMPGKGTIRGEVYEVTPAVFGMLDQLEGHPQWYRREQVRPSSTGKAPCETAWIYWGHGVSHGEKIESGDWLAETAPR